MSKKATGIGLAALATLLTGLACSRADVPFQPPEEEAAVVQVIIPTHQFPTPITPEPTPIEIPTEIPEPIPTNIPDPTPTTEPTPTEEPLPDELLEWQDLCYEPGQCAHLLLESGWRHYENDWTVYKVKNYAASPLKSLENMAGDCEDVVMLLAAGLLDDGYQPYFLVVTGDDEDNNPENGDTNPINHVVYPYKVDALWGYVGINLYDRSGTWIGANVEEMTPQFGSLLVLFDHYQKNHDFSHDFTRYYLVDLTRVPDWLTTMEEVGIDTNDVIADTNPDTPHPLNP